jgi:hypothetical protein
MSTRLLTEDEKKKLQEKLDIKTETIRKNPSAYAYNSLGYIYYKVSFLSYMYDAL